MMSVFYSSKGIVISKIKYKETSYILKIFTEKFGLISVIVHGARKSNSQYLGYFNIMNELHFDLIKSANSEIYLLKDADFIRFFLKNIPYKSQAYFYIVNELIRKIYTDEYDIIYQLIIKYFESLIENKIRKIYIFWRFLAKFLQILGNPIFYDNCYLCGSKLTSKRFISKRGDGFICEFCSQNNKAIKAISSEATMIFEKFRNLGNVDLEIADNTIQEINSIFLLHLKTHFHQDFNLTLLNELN